MNGSPMTMNISIISINLILQETRSSYWAISPLIVRVYLNSFKFSQWAPKKPCEIKWVVAKEVVGRPFKLGCQHQQSIYFILVVTGGPSNIASL